MKSHDHVFCHTWADAAGFRWPALRHQSSGKNPEAIRGFGIQAQDVCASGRAGLGQDGAERVAVAFGLTGAAVGAHQGRSAHLDVKTYIETFKRGRLECQLSGMMAWLALKDDSHECVR